MIESLLDFLRILTTPDRLLSLLATAFAGWWGYALLFAIAFAETGLLEGFFLPGDSLLFTVGVAAGVAGMSYPRFLSFNIFCGIGWVFSLAMMGYWLGNVAPVRAHFEKVIVGIIFVSLLPLVFEAVKAFRSEPVKTGTSNAD